MKAWRPPYLILAFVLGCLPAVLILALVTFSEDDMRMLGFSLPGYGLAALFALSLSPIRPLLLLLGPALAFAVQHESLLRRWLTFMLIPMVWVTPLLVAAMIKGSSFSTDLLLASFLLCSSVTAFAAWFRLFSRLPGGSATGLILYGVCWSLSGFLHYLALYVVPYQDASWLQALASLRFALPQLGYAFEMIDEGLAGAGWPLLTWAPLLVQLPLLLAIDGLLPKRQRLSAKDQHE